MQLLRHVLDIAESSICARPRRCITMDDSGCVWLGSASGDVRAVALAVQKQPHGGLSKRIEARTTLKWGGLGSAPGSAQDTPAARTPSLTSLTSLASSWTTFGAVPCLSPVASEPLYAD